MANVYHVNPETGRANICRAKTRDACPLKDDNGEKVPHSLSKSMAQKHGEDIMQKKHGQFNNLKKDSSKLSDMSDKDLFNSINVSSDSVDEDFVKDSLQGSIHEYLMYEYDGQDFSYGYNDNPDDDDLSIDSFDSEDDSSSEIVVDSLDSKKVAQDIFGNLADKKNNVNAKTRQEAIDRLDGLVKKHGLNNPEKYAVIDHYNYGNEVSFDNNTVIDSFVNDFKNKLK